MDLLQLQLEMLATGTSSAIVAIASPHNGTHLFRVPRSDTYLQEMLNVVKMFYTR